MRMFRVSEMRLTEAAGDKLSYNAYRNIERFIREYGVRSVPRILAESEEQMKSRVSRFLREQFQRILELDFSPDMVRLIVQEYSIEQGHLIMVGDTMCNEFQFDVQREAEDAPND